MSLFAAQLTDAPDGGPFTIVEFATHDSMLQFRSLNHAPSGIINPLWPVMADANIPILLPLLEVQQT